MGGRILARHGGGRSCASIRVPWRRRSSPARPHAAGRPYTSRSSAGSGHRRSTDAAHPLTSRAHLRADAIATLEANGDPTPALDADVLLAHALGVPKEAIYAHPEERVPDALARHFAQLIHRRAGGEPVAYLRGWKEFYGLGFAVDPRVLIPRPETEVLVDAVRELVRAGGAALVADVGTGSGAIAVALVVREPSVRAIATDASEDALAVARENARAHRVAHRIDLRRGDLLEPIHERVDAVVANLPYLREADAGRLAGERTSLRFEPARAVFAGADGLALIRRCVSDLPRVLAPGGRALFECDPPQAQEVSELLSAALGGPTRIVCDLAGDARVVIAQRSRELSG
ncbi:MAG: peptide chain release factor N(5)-glutamine methyltransferase [Candidatus Limnocylindria bacterium]